MYGARLRNVKIDSNATNGMRRGVSCKYSFIEELGLTDSHEFCIGGAHVWLMRVPLALTPIFSHDR